MIQVEMFVEFYSFAIVQCFRYVVVACQWNTLWVVMPRVVVFKTFKLEVIAPCHFNQGSDSSIVQNSSSCQCSFPQTEAAAFQHRLVEAWLVLCKKLVYSDLRSRVYPTVLLCLVHLCMSEASPPYSPRLGAFENNRP